MSTVRPVRFGMTSHMSSVDGWRNTARKAEELGYSTLAVSDHVETPLAPLTSLAAAAEATSSLLLASYVFGNDFWHPAILAREVATLDLISGGRVEFGIGTGWRRTECEA
jgi:alkanesulfonate monooxygenase SsuD/methylene tetrahydromethanopterin reductase-like flavin-dependent oxidoreductase (luciferase family)